MIMVAVFMVLVFLLSCESKQDQAKQLAKEVVNTVYKDKIPQKYKDIWTNIEKLYGEGKLTYDRAKPWCDKADALSRNFAKLIDKYKRAAKEKNIYNEFISLLGELKLKHDCLYSPTTALWSSIDQVCSELQNKGSVEPDTWRRASEKFKSNYEKAIQIRDKCVELLS